jgi:hypothetical protein
MVMSASKHRLKHYSLQVLPLIETEMIAFPCIGLLPFTDFSPFSRTMGLKHQKRIASVFEIKFGIADI